MSKSFTVVKSVLGDPDRTHAVLLAGHEGSGVREAGTELARGWLCTGGSPPCGACQACRSFDAGSCVDFQIIEPVGASRNILLKAIVPVETEEPPETIPLSQFFRTSPLMAKRKVAMISDADRMNQRACNALLKMLEEPPKFGKFILTTGSISRLPTTILSRCLCILCPLPDEQELHDQFGDLSEVEAIFGEHAPDRVARVRAHPVVYQELTSVFEAISSSPRGGALKLAEQMRSHGEGLGDKLGIGTRQGNAEVLRALGRWWIAKGAPHPAVLAAIAESHRGVLGNGSAPAIFDALVTEVMSLRELEVSPTA